MAREFPERAACPPHSRILSTRLPACLLAHSPSSEQSPRSRHLPPPPSPPIQASRTEDLIRLAAARVPARRFKNWVSWFVSYYRAVRAQASLERILEHLDLLKTLRPSGGELRGPCPIHSSDDKRRRDFAVNLKKDVFCCFHPSCAARGNQLDLWALLHDQTTYQAAQDLTNTFQLTTTGPEKRSP